MIIKALIKISFAGAGLILGFVVSMYITAGLSGFEGRRGGQQDAFRHMYSSALVSKYISPQAVDLVSYLFEADAESKHNAMDRHNNSLGARLANESGLGPRGLYQSVYKKVLNAKGLKTASKTEAVVLPKVEWTNGF